MRARLPPKPNADILNLAASDPKRAQPRGERIMPETQKATFAAGCFWGVEETFRRQPGVINTQVGYTGGHTENPDYKQVCTGLTGHAEAVEVEFDPAQTSFGALLNVFWGAHDPTQVNRQGPDHGTQYRSAIFFHNPDQQEEADAARESLTRAGKFPRPIATQIVAAGPFWRAEEYHQRYLQKRGVDVCH